MPRYIEAVKLMAEFDKCLWGKEWDKALARACVDKAPTADVQEVITLESAIDFLHKIGWLQEHDKALTEVRHGKWLVVDDDLWRGGGRYECSACGYGFSFGGFFEMNTLPYCPHCGAKMEVPDEEPT